MISTLDFFDSDSDQSEQPRVQVEPSAAPSAPPEPPRLVVEASLAAARPAEVGDEPPVVASDEPAPGLGDEPELVASLPVLPVPHARPFDLAGSHSAQFTDTALAAFPFAEWRLRDAALEAYCLFHWYRLWDVPAPALRPHASAPWNPCSNPVTLDECNAPLLRAYPYVISTKTNGVRVQLFCLRHPATRAPLALMVDRNVNFYDVGALCLAGEAERLAAGAILDGEFVRARDGGWAFVLFDGVAFDSAPLRHAKSLKRRLERVWESYGALVAEPARLPLGRAESMRWLTKGMFSMRDPLALRRVLQEERDYETDGFVFTPQFLSIPFETSQFLLKWKPDELHSVDFRLVGHAPTEKRPKWGLELLYKFQGKERNILQGFSFIGYFFAMGRVVLRDSPALQALLEAWDAGRGPFSQIVECRLDVLDTEGERMEWSVVRARSDKSDPNSEITLIGTLRTIMFPVSLASLKQLCELQ